MAVTTKQKKATKSVDEAAQTVTFKFADGGNFVAKLGDMPATIATRLALHGLAQKLGDTYAGDVESAEAEVRDMYGELANGHWSTRAPGEPRITLLAEAMASLRPVEGVSHEERTKQAMRKLEEVSDEERAALRKDPRIKLAIAQIQAKRLRDAAKKAPEGVKLDF
jgi:hypothetical protein